jgi:hypothetical protein
MKTIPVGHHVVGLHAEWLTRRNQSGTQHFTLSGTVTEESRILWQVDNLGPGPIRPQGGDGMTAGKGLAFFGGPHLVVEWLGVDPDAVVRVSARLIQGSPQ